MGCCGSCVCPLKQGPNPTHNPNTEVIKLGDVNNHSLNSKQERNGYSNNKGKQRQARIRTKKMRETGTQTQLRTYLARLRKACRQTWVFK